MEKATFAIGYYEYCSEGCDNHHLSPAKLLMNLKDSYKQLWSLMGSYVGAINFDLKCYFYKARVMQITNKIYSFLKSLLIGLLTKRPF